MDKKIFLIRLDADHFTGIGHLTRCLALGKGLESEGEKVVFAFKYLGEAVEKSLRRHQVQYFKIPRRLSWTKEVAYLLKKLPLRKIVVVLDISTVYAFKDKAGVADYLKILGSKGKVVLLDGMGENALSSQMAGTVDVVIMPYCGAKKTTLYSNFKAKKWLLGPAYYVFSPEYRPKKNSVRVIHKEAKKVLVTMGGSDSFRVTLKVFKGLQQIKDRKLEIIVVIGPNFNKTLQAKIKRYCLQSRHSCVCVNAPSTLYANMLNTDIAITSSGLTKYELAATGTPALQISFNGDHARVNQPFLKLRTIRHLGVFKVLSQQRLKAAVVALLDDFKAREKMSRKGMRSFDALGMMRIVKVLRRIK